jgi:cytochrome P450
MIHEFRTFFSAGSDTTSTLVSWCLYFLHAYPEATARMREEAARVDLANVAASTGHDLPWLNGFIRETQRLMGPINNVIIREAQEDVLLDDLLLPRGTLVTIEHEYNHCHPRFFQQPYEFRPERWFNGEVDGLPPFAFVPFSSGPRNCIGQHLALLEARLILLNFLRHWQIEVQQPFQPIADPNNAF